MMQFFSIGEASRLVGVTAETLRHYDRIGLVSPSRRDPFTGYRYYTEQEIVWLNTVKALRYMDLSLSEIKSVLDLENLQEVVRFLKGAEEKADDKIQKLFHARERIRRARREYEKKTELPPSEEEVSVQVFPQRAILLSQTLEQPSLENLWNYLSHFYGQLPEERREQYSFADLAGVYRREGKSRLFALCSRFPDEEGLELLPKGRYLCSACSEENREQATARLMERARREQGREPAFALQLVVISGILRWSYQIQIPLE